MQATTEGPVLVSDSKLNIRVALLEKSNEYTEDMLGRIEKKVDKVDSKVDKLELKIFGNFKWFLGISLSGITAVASMGFAIYQYVKH